MEAKELRQLGPDELKTKVGQWREELFRAKFKAQSSESKDTSVFRKLRRDIARGETILGELARSGKAPTVKAKPVEDKAVTETAPKAKKAATAAKKKTTRKTAAKE